MSYKVFWTPEAEDTFNQNILYLEYEWTEAVIENFIQKADETINAICLKPLLCPLRNREAILSDFPS